MAVLSLEAPEVDPSLRSVACQKPHSSWLTSWRGRNPVSVCPSFSSLVPVPVV